MHTRSIVLLAGALLLSPALATAATGSVGAARAQASVGQVAIVQAVPDEVVGVSVDGKAVDSGARTGAVVGPLELAPGKHRIDFSGPAAGLATTVQVEPGSSQDVVVHLPASVGGAAVVTAYATPLDPIGPGKARVLVAHTATVAPADVRVDGQVVFTNIANGEFATADVPAGHHVVELLPTGETTNPILGPLDVEVAEQTITMVYAVGNPADGDMGLVSHVVRLAADGAVVPEAIATGSFGLARWLRVVPFGPRGATP